MSQVQILCGPPSFIDNIKLLSFFKPFAQRARVYFASRLIFLAVKALVLVKLAVRNGFSSGLHKGLDIILVDFLFFQQQLRPFDKQFLSRFEDIKGYLVLA